MTTWTTDEMGPSLSDPVADLETPALLIDLGAMERNIDEYGAEAGFWVHRVCERVGEWRLPKLVGLALRTHQHLSSLACVPRRHRRP